MARPYYGWFVVGACFLGSFVLFGVSYSFGVFLERILETFGASRGLTALAFGVQTAAVYVGASLVGVLVDRYGTRRMLLAGAAATAVGLVLASRARSLAALIATYGVLTGVGLSVVYVVSYATVTRWFDRRLGLAGGLASAGLGVGMLAGVPAATWLLARLGWRGALVAFAAVAAALLAVAAAVIRDDPGAAGTEPPPAEFSGATPAANRGSLAEQYAEVRPVAVSAPFALVFGGWTLVYGSLYVLLAHLVAYAVDIGLPRATGATALALLGAASAVGRVGIGHVADVAGRLRVFTICSAVMGIATLGFIWARTPGALLAVAVLYGLAYGGNGALLSPVVADLFGRANIGAVFGLASMAFAVSGLVAPAAAGTVRDAVGTYEPALAVVGVAALAGAVAVAVARRAA